MRKRLMEISGEVKKMDYKDLYSEKFIVLVRGKLNSIGVVKTVKYVRVETSISMIEGDSRKVPSLSTKPFH